jgi:hypothetical protein
MRGFRRVSAIPALFHCVTVATAEQFWYRLVKKHSCLMTVTTACRHLGGCTASSPTECSCRSSSQQQQQHPTTAQAPAAADMVQAGSEGATGQPPQLLHCHRMRPLPFQCQRMAVYSGGTWKL